MGSDRGKVTWAAYAAFVWAAVFGIAHFYWARGGRLGFSAAALAAQGFQQGWFLIYDIVAGALCLFSAGVALALVQEWGKRISRRLLLVLAWGACAVLLLRGLVGLAQDLTMSVAERQSAEVWFDPWFVLGGALFGLAAWVYQRGR